MADEASDQPTATPYMTNGQHYQVTSAQLKAAAPANTCYKFTHTFSHQIGHQLATFRSGVTYQLDAPLKAQLLALSAPMVAA